MISKKFINKAEDVVTEQLDGLAISDPHRVTFSKEYNVLIRTDIEVIKNKQVTLISGGGSGHEPSFGGYVGHGFLSAAVCGEVFSSPSEASILYAIRKVCGTMGCLLIIMNYTGDRLNFGLAMEQAKMEGFKIEMVTVGDDCALPKSKGITGRRGIAGTILIQKIASSAAEAKLPLEKVYREALNSSKIVGSAGIALSVCSRPGLPSSERLEESDIEVGLGIHGEPGVFKQKIDSANRLAETALNLIISGNDDEPFLEIKAKDRVVLMVNNLGGSTKMEEMIMTRAVLNLLWEKDIQVERFYCGHFMTALDMCGISISLLKVDDLMLARLDSISPVEGWRPGTVPSKKTPIRVASEKVLQEDTHSESLNDKIESGYSLELQNLIKKCIRSASHELINKKEQLDEWDATAGDGDCGSTFARGAKSILTRMDKSDGSESFRCEDLKSTLMNIGEVAGAAMGGTSGALLLIFFRAAARSSDKGWIESIKAGTDAVSFFGGAKKGMRTLLDVLHPLSTYLGQVEDQILGIIEIKNAIDLSEQGAKSTIGMKALAGRSNYVQEEALKDIPDPGAMAVFYIVQAVLTTWIKERNLNIK